MKLIILDRDGVINFESEAYIKSPNEWQPIPGSLEAIAALTNAGYKIAIATNQSGIARGLYDATMLQQIHEKLLTEVHKHGGHIAKIAYCPHEDTDDCSCRKPKPGLLIEIAKYFNITLNNVPFIGDSYRDIAAGNAVNCQCILVRTGNGAETLKKHPELNAIKNYADLNEAVHLGILKKNS